MATITKEQIKRIYALGGALGLVVSGSHDDHLHDMIHRLTEKDSVRDLTAPEFRNVERELLTLLQYKNRTAPLKAKPKPDTAPGMMNPAQQGLAWRMIYRLQELDTKNSTAIAGQRMVGAIKRILGVDAGVEKPFDWVTFEQGTQLIEHLKRYVRSAEGAARKRGSG
jgi:hypothetical protein